MIKNIHSLTLESIKKQLPKGSVVKEAYSVSEDESILKVELNEVINELRLEKEDINDILNSSIGVVKVKPGTTSVNALVKFLIEANVKLIPNVDYEINNLPREVNEYLDLEILPTSVVAKGKFTIRVEVEGALDDSVVDCPGCELKARVLLNSVIFDNVEDDLFNENKLSDSLIEKVLELFEDKPYKFKPTKDILDNSTIQEVGEDNLSKIIVLFTEELGSLTIRYNDKALEVEQLPEERTITLDNGQVLEIVPGEATLVAPDYSLPDNPEMFSPGPPVKKD